MAIVALWSGRCQELATPLQKEGRCIPNFFRCNVLWIIEDNSILVCYELRLKDGDRLIHSSDPGIFTPSAFARPSIPSHPPSSRKQGSIGSVYQH